MFGTQVSSAPDSVRAAVRPMGVAGRVVSRRIAEMDTMREGLPLRSTAGPDLVAFGRIHPDKGTAQAIAIAVFMLYLWVRGG